MTVRSELLRAAADVVDGDRNASYGDPNQDFRRTAQMWNAYVTGVFERALAERNYFGMDQDLVDRLVLTLQHMLDSQDIAWMMILLKASRSTVSPDKHDHYLDAAGYAACGWHCVAPVDGNVEPTLRNALGEDVCRYES